MSVTRHFATGDDIVAIAKVHIQAWRETYRGLLPDHVLDELREDRRAEQWRRVFAANEGNAMNAQFVAEIHGDVVGFGSCGHGRYETCTKAGYEAEINSLYLLKRVQKQGVGTALFLRMLRHLADHGVDTASCWVLDTNAGARRFYERRDGVAFAERSDKGRGFTTTEIAYGWDAAAFKRALDRA